MKEIMQASSGVRRFGAAALDLAFVAAGRYDGFWERGLSLWDIAAGYLLVKKLAVLFLTFLPAITALFQVMLLPQTAPCTSRS